MEQDADGACEDIGSYVSGHAGEILVAWEAEVALLPAADRLTRPALRNRLPDFLVELGRVLEEDRRTRRFAELAGEHAAHRLSRGIDLRHVTREYGVLRRVILEGYRKACSAGVDLFEIQCLDEAIDHALMDAVDRYVRLREETRQHFVDILGHDLRTPLSAIASSADYLRETVAEEQQREAVTRIDRSGERINSMVEVLLDLARTRLGAGIPVAPAPASMDTLARAVADELCAAHPGRQVAVEASGDLAGEWDPDRTAQAISNVLSNAMEHGEDPIRLVLRGEDPGTVVVEITNAGEPIAAEKLRTLFDPYAGRDKNARAPRSGLGLGLFIACEILTAHGGNIRVRSSRETGTTFTMRWPRRPPAEAT